MSDPLVAFLRAQLDEDERVALAAEPLRLHLPWPKQAGKATYLTYANRFDPQWMLAEVEAKRRILDLHRLTVEKVDKPPFDPYTGKRTEEEFDVTCDLCGWASDNPASGCETLRAMTIPYRDRPGYGPTWAPSPSGQ